MDNYFKLIISQINAFFKGMDKESRKKLIIIASLLLIVITAFSLIVTRKEYTVLYSNLDSREAGEILNKLEEMKADVKPEGNGTILVLKSQEAKLRMQLAVEGYPKSGNNYSPKDNPLGMGATDYDKKRAERLELQDHLRSAIRTMEGVLDAVVTISMPEQDSFVLKDDRQETTASVLLKLGNYTLTKKQIKGIEELVAKSVLGLKPENISIVDSQMNALNVKEASESGSYDSHFEMENEVRNSLQNQVYTLLEPVFGKGNVVASVNVKLNFDKQVSEIVRFEPVTDDSGIAISINELKEEVSSSQDLSGQVQYASGSEGQGAYEKSNKTINYEVNQIKEKIEKALGKVEELTLSILINNSNLDSNTLENVQKIVSTAMGVDEENVLVSGMNFEGREHDLKEIESKNKEADSIVRNKRIRDIIKYFIYALIILFILFLIYKLILKLKISFKGMDDYMVSSSINPKFANEVVEMPQADNEQILKKKNIDALIENKPEIAAQKIRDWLNEE